MISPLSRLFQCSHPNHSREPGGVYYLEDVQSFSTESHYTEPVLMRDPSAAMILYGEDDQ